MPTDYQPQLLNTNAPQWQDAFNATQGVANANALSGVQATQAKNSLNAFQGIDFSDPQSVINGAGNLIKAGNPDAASALLGINFQQGVRSQVAPVMKAQMALEAAKLQAQTQAIQGQSPQDSSQQGQPNIAAIASHANDTLGLASQGIEQIKQLPTDQRPQAVAQLSEQLKARGLDQERIDSATNWALEPPDQKTQDERLNSLAQHISDHSANFQAIAAGQPAPNPQASLQHPSNEPWYNNIASDSSLNNPFVVAGFKAAGFDLEPQLQRAAQLAMPGITKSTEAQYAPSIAAGMAEGKTEGENATVKKPFYIPGSTVPLQMTQNEANDFQKQHGVNLSTEPEAGAKAAAEASGTARGKLPYEQPTAQAKASGEFLGSMHDFHGTDQNGNPVTRQMLGEDYIAARAAGVPTSTIGNSPSEVDVDWKKAQQASFGKVVDAAADNMKNYPKDDLNNHQLLSLANAVGTGAYTKTLSEAANNLAPILGPGAAKAYGADANLLGQAISQYTRSQFNGALPRIRSEFDVVTGSLAKNNVLPQDQIKVDALLGIAKRNYDNEMNKYFVGTASQMPNRSTAAAQTAWDSSQGSKSLLAYALPDLQKTTINGKPAVSPVIEYQGHHWAQFLPGSTHPMKFMVD